MDDVLLRKTKRLGEGSSLHYLAPYICTARLDKTQFELISFNHLCAGFMNIMCGATMCAVKLMDYLDP